MGEAERSIHALDGNDRLTAGDLRRARKSNRRRKGVAERSRDGALDSELEPWPAVMAEDRPCRGLSGYEWWRAAGSPKYVCAPMVGGSSLAFRLLVRRYGVDLAYGPMIDAEAWAHASAAARRDAFLWSKPSALDLPLVAQLAGDDPRTVAAAARDLAPSCDAVDLNCGCPQACAEFGRYGAFLLSQPDTILAVVREVVRTADVPITVKLRKPTLEPEDTVALARRLEAAGVTALTVHGRTKEQVRDARGISDWDVVAAVKRSVSIPVILNGGIASRGDALRALEETGCDAVMSAEALLERPSLFAEQPPLDQVGVAQEFLDIARECRSPARVVGYHLLIMLHGAFQKHPDLLRSAPINGSIDAWESCVAAVRERNKSGGAISPTTSPGSWYLRHRPEFRPRPILCGGPV